MGPKGPARKKLTDHKKAETLTAKRWRRTTGDDRWFERDFNSRVPRLKTQLGGLQKGGRGRTGVFKLIHVRAEQVSHRFFGSLLLGKKKKDVGERPRRGAG